MDLSSPPMSYCLLTCSRSLSDPHHFSPALNLLSRWKAPSTWTSPVPATCQSLSLVHEPCTACLLLPSFTVTLWYPPCTPLAWTQVPVIHRGVCLFLVSLCLCVPALSYPRFPPNIGIVRSFMSYWLYFRVRARGQGVSTPWQLRVLDLSPSAIW